MRFTHRMRALLTGLILVGFLPGCRDKSPNQATVKKPRVHLRVGLQDEPKTIDPTIFMEAAGHQILMNTYKGLVDYDQQTLALKPAVAERWAVLGDGQVYRFHLRRDAVWWGGDLKQPEPVTAHDFVYAWRRLINPVNEAQYIKTLQDMGVVGMDEYFARADQYAPLAKKKKAAEEAGNAAEAKTLQEQMQAVLADLEAMRLTSLGFHAMDDYTLEVRLKDRSRGRLFLKYLGLTALAPVHQATIAKWGKEWTKPEHYVVNGPYLVTAHAQGATWRLTKNPHYWDAGKVAIDEITFVISADSEVLLRNYESRNPADTLHWLGAATQIPPSRVQDWKTRPDYRFSNLLSNYFIEFHVRQAPLDNSRVRQALCYGVDRQELVDKVTKAGQIPARGFIPTVTGEYAEIAQGFTFDPERARALLAQAGYPGGRGLPPITYTFNSSTRHEAVAVALQAMWQKHLGVRVELAQQEWPAFLSARIQDTLQMARGGWAADCADPYNFAMISLTGSEHNYGKWSNAHYDELVYAARDHADARVRERLYQEADQLIVEEAPLCPLFIDAHPTLIKPQVQGFHANVLNYNPIDQLSLRR